MALFNTKKEFGFLTKLVHWGIFLLVCAQFYLINRREYFSDSMPEKLQYILLHKSFGVIILGLAILFIVLHFIGTRPALPKDMKSHEVYLAKFTHTGLFGLLLLMPISGYMMSAYAGYPVTLKMGPLGDYVLPMLVDKNEALAKIAKEGHEYLAFALLALVALHVFGALFHHFVRKDDILKRMAPH